MLGFLIYSLILFLPVNLGKHYIYRFSYVSGLLVDYFVPTIFIQDLLCLFIIMSFAFYLLVSKKQLRFNYGWLGSIILIYLLVSGLSVISSINIGSSVFAFFRLLVYVLASFVISVWLNFKNRWKNVIYALSISVTFICLIGFGQTLLQHSLFNNYLFFGEQPYNASTYNIYRENLFNKLFIPPYSLFRHPNIFGGYLSIIVIWLIHFLISNYFKLGKIPKKILLLGILFCIISIFLTFSLVAILSLFFGVLFLLATCFLPTKRLFFALLIVLFVFLIFFSLSFPLIPDFGLGNASYTKRTTLFNSTLSSIQENYLFGTGINTNPQVISSFGNDIFGVKHPQPVHNIFLLTLSETGIFGFLSYLLIFLYLIGDFFIRFRVSRNVNFFGISLLQFVILGSFDHYLITIHQTSLLFWLTVGFYISYNYCNNNSVKKVK